MRCLLESWPYPHALHAGLTRMRSFPSFGPQVRILKYLLSVDSERDRAELLGQAFQPGGARQPPCPPALCLAELGGRASRLRVCCTAPTSDHYVTVPPAAGPA